MRYLLRFATLLAVVFTGIAWAPAWAEAPASYAVHPIGQVERKEGKTFVVLDEQYQPALLRLDDFSHVWVIWWFHEHDNAGQRSILQVHPRRDSRNPLSGVFATRAPVRPNLIGLTLCKIVSVQGNLLEVDEIDAYDGTPVLDLKPYIPSREALPEAEGPKRH